MKLKDIHSACSDLLDTDVSYRALKNGLSDHQRSKHPIIVRAERGLYRAELKNVPRRLQDSE